MMEDGHCKSLICVLLSSQYIFHPTHTENCHPPNIASDYLVLKLFVFDGIILEARNGRHKSKTCSVHPLKVVVSLSS